MLDPDLWDRCRGFPMPTGPDDQSFATWVGEEEGLSKNSANELVLEYRRFLYLAASGAVERPVAPTGIAKVIALHAASGQLPQFCQQILDDVSFIKLFRPDRRSVDAILGAYATEFGKPANTRIWAYRTRAWIWGGAAALLAAGGVGSIIDGDLKLLVLGGLSATLLIFHSFMVGKVIGTEGMSDAARYSGGSGGGGLN